MRVKEKPFQGVWRCGKCVIVREVLRSQRNRGTYEKVGDKDWPKFVPQSGMNYVGTASTEHSINAHWHIFVFVSMVTVGIKIDAIKFVLETWLRATMRKLCRTWDKTG